MRRPEYQQTKEETKITRTFRQKLDDRTNIAFPLSVLSAVLTIVFVSKHDAHRVTYIQPIKRLRTLQWNDYTDSCLGPAFFHHQQPTMPLN
jgi:hypothetical protein